MAAIPGASISQPTAGRLAPPSPPRESGSLSFSSVSRAEAFSDRVTVITDLPATLGQANSIEVLGDSSLSLRVTRVLRRHFRATESRIFISPNITHFISFLYIEFTEFSPDYIILRFRCSLIAWFRRGGLGDVSDACDFDFSKLHIPRQIHTSQEQLPLLLHDARSQAGTLTRASWRITSSVIECPYCCRHAYVYAVISLRDAG